jgi:predicted RNase H-like nuclease
LAGNVPVEAGPARRVAGVDGCRGGWLVADDEGIAVVPSFGAVMARDYDVVGVDMPIGLPDGWFRAADRDARRFLGPRRSSVFPVPPRPLLDATSWDEANITSRTRYGQGVPRQTWHLFPKLREVDASVTPADEDRVLEISPECAFVVMTGEPLPPKRTALGRHARIDAVQAAFGQGVALGPVRGAAPDDVLDAHAVRWSALRFARGLHRSFGDGERDGRGLLMRIIA